MLMRILTALFRREEINGGHRCPTYLYRWTVFQPRRPRAVWRGFGVYLHKFVGDDWSRDLHDHPKRFISIGLWGRYVEHTPLHDYDEQSLTNQLTKSRPFVAPWVRSFPATHIHRITLDAGRPCWTLVIVLRAVREWGFWHNGYFIKWSDYVKGWASGIADHRKACP